MAELLYPSSFRCDCGHETHFCENTVKEMQEKSRRKKQVLIGAEIPEHEILFDQGRPVAMFCPKLGRCPIK